MRHSRKISSFLLIIFLVGLDQLAKYLVIKFYPELVSTNSGISFGLGSGLSKNLIIALSSILIVALLFYFEKTKYKTAFVFLISGAAGNLIDRLWRSSVVDYINIRIWPSFNLADAMLSIGVLLIAINLLFSKDS